MKTNVSDPINLNHFLFKMFEKYPKVATCLIGFIVVAPYIPHALNGLNVYKTVYEKGKKDGYQKARKEIQTKAEEAIKKTNDYVSEDLKSVCDGNHIEWEYVKDKLKILLLPRFQTTLLGDEYVFRYNLKSSWNTAWLLKKSDSETLDKNIMLLLSNCSYDVKNFDAGIQIQKIRKHQEQDLEELVCNIISKNKK